MSKDIRPFDLSIAAGRGAAAGHWLVVGKGPSSSKFEPSLARSHNVFALNHAMGGIEALVGHAIDVEVFEHLSPDALERVEYLCVPWIPHVRQHRPLYGGKVFFGPGTQTLADYCDTIPVLRSYRSQGRLLSYNFCSAAPSRRLPGLPYVTGYSFSAAVALRLLAQSGATEVRTLGVDGGNAYASAFGAIAAKTKLQTAQTSFDEQFKEMAATMKEFNTVSGPMDAGIPARVFVGCMPEQDLAYRVLEYSIHRHSSVSVRVERLHDAIEQSGFEVPVPRDPRNQGRTPFSFQRFAIPALCNHEGRAVYVDSDMLVLRDLRSLWMFDMHDHQMVSAAQPAGSGRRPQFSVMLIDCDRLRWNVRDVVSKLDAGELSYEQVMYDMATVQRWAADLPETWNSLEHYEPESTCLVHFTDMDGQPWLNPLHPHSALWSRYLLDAVREGAISRTLVEEEVKRGHVRPSLLAQLDQDEEDALRLPFATLRRDLTEFFPPHRRQGRRLSRIKHELYRTRALVSHVVGKGLVQPTVRAARRFASSLISAATR